MAMTAAQGKNYRNTIVGRASAMYHTTIKGAKQRNIDFELPLSWYKEKLAIGVCEKTKLPFVLKPEKSPFTVTSKNQVRNPFAPSVERLDSNKGYTEDNCVMVVCMYNFAKGVFSEEALRIFCKAYLANDNS